MAQVTVNTAALQIIGWHIEDQDQGFDLEIHWTHEGRVKALRPDVDGGDWLPYDIDRAQWLDVDLPTLRQMNEAENFQA